MSTALDLPSIRCKSYHTQAAISTSGLHDVHGEKFNLLSIKQRHALVAQEDQAPNKCREPHVCVAVGLVLADNNGVRHWEQPHHRRIVDVSHYKLVIGAMLLHQALHLRHKELQSSIAVVL